jgi:hypothetical protein
MTRTPIGWALYPDGSCRPFVGGETSEEKNLRTSVAITMAFAFAIVAGTIYVIGKRFA